jgi:hypothetical protein
VSLKDSWAQFSAIPSGTSVSSGTVRFFPFKGHFCMSIGKAVWSKKNRDTTDRDNLSKAVNNWPKLYEDNWVKAGDNCLPAADLKDVTTFATLTADNQTIKWYTVILDKDSKLQFCEQSGQSDLKDGLTFTTLTYKHSNSSDPSTAPAWQRATYFNGNIVAYDQAGTLWTLKVDFDKKTYKISSSVQDNLPTGTELTASEIGPIINRSDGKLYRRVIDLPSSANSNPSPRWETWIALDGVRNLGVASPGVRLDLKMLTRVLRSRYVEAQTAIEPVAQQLHTFAVTHKAWLNKVKAAAVTYKAETDTFKKNKIAADIGKESVEYINIFSQIITNVSATAEAKEIVRLMGEQMKAVKNDLNTELSVLQKRLKDLRTRLESEESILSAAKVGFWISLGALLLSKWADKRA